MFIGTALYQICTKLINCTAFNVLKMSVVSRKFVVKSGQVTNLSINSFDKFTVVDMTRQRNIIHVEHCIQLSVT